MRSIIISLLILCSLDVFAKGNDSFIDLTSITAYNVNYSYDATNKLSISGLQDYLDKEEKVTLCIEGYVKKQSKSYSKVAQGNLYNLINNFDSIVSKLYGKKAEKDNITYEEKIAALAQVQCDAYYKMGVLR